MKFKNSIRFSMTLLAIMSGLAGTTSAQEKPSDKELTTVVAAPSASQNAETGCFADGDPIVDNLPKRPTSKNEQHIIDKILHLVTEELKSQKLTFSHLDKDHNCKLDRSEVSELLRESHISGIVRLIATGRLIDRYDLSNDGYVEWREFHFAIDKALKKRAQKQAEKKVAASASP